MKTIEDIIAAPEDSDLIGKVFGAVIATVLVNKGAGPFICGTLRKPGTDGLHEGSDLPDLSLQLQLSFEMGFARVGLMSPAPGRPCEDAGVGDTPLG